MVKRTTTKGTKKPRKRGKANRFPLIEKALGKRTKAELIEIVMKMAKKHATFLRELEDQLRIEKPVDLLVADVSSAIDRATSFDEREINFNFDVDWQAYTDAQKGLGKLVDLGCLEDAQLLALKLMKDGSYQVECSDEGLMTDDIEDCLRPVIRAVKAPLRCCQLLSPPACPSGTHRPSSPGTLTSTTDESKLRPLPISCTPAESTPKIRC